MINFLIASGVIFWINVFVIFSYYIYDKIETEYFVWNQKRKWNKHLKQQEKL